MCASAVASADQIPLAGVAQLSARGGHACVATTDGAALCWGSNSKGQLGSGPVGPYRNAASVVTDLGSGVIAIAAAAGAHSCAVVSGGGVKCWGANESGQLGDGTTIDRPFPADVVGLPWPAVGLTAGISHTCAFSTDGAVACWGGNSHGQVGDGTTTPRLTPAVVPGLSAVVEMSAAIEHTCALTAAGAMKCWGFNDAGQLGDGTQADRPSPVDVQGLASGVTSIATGGAPSPSFVFGAFSKTCAVAAGVMKCWGGVNGTASFSGTTTPVDVAGAPGGLAQITLGGSWFHTLGASGNFVVMQTCGVSSTGAARCWGTDVCGLVGTGNPPECTMAWLSSPAYFIAPSIEVAGASANVVDVSAAAGFTCALLSSGEVKCWGGAYGSSATAAVEGQSSQTIFWNLSAPFVAVGGTGTLSLAFGSSGTPIVYTSLTPGVCSVSGTTVTGLAGGTCTIAASQPGTAYFDPSPQVTQSFQIDARTAQVITFDQAPSSLTVGGVAIVTASSSSGRPPTIGLEFSSACTVSGNVVTGTDGFGTCYLRASLPGDALYAPGEAFAQIPVTANAGTQAVIVYTMGGGTGTIMSNPDGLACVSGTCAGNFPNGSTVTVTAVPAQGSRFDGWTGACTGTGDCALTMDAAKTATAHFGSDTVRLSNLSTRGQVVSGSNPMIAGFVISGTGSKTVLIRALGISLAAFGVDNALPNPKIHLYSGQTQLTENDQWRIGSGQGFPPPPQPALPLIEASGLQPTNFDEPAIWATLAPGAYTVIVTPSGGAGGVGIVELFEIDRAEQPLINISTRGQVGSDNDVMIAGFTIAGSAPQTVAVLGKGPSLEAFGVTGVLGNPSLRLVRMSDLATLAVNDNWGDAPNASAIAASGFAPSNDQESAILVTLEPGAYTAILSGVGRMTGVGIVEVYRVGN